MILFLVIQFACVFDISYEKKTNMNWSGVIINLQDFYMGKLDILSPLENMGF